LCLKTSFFVYPVFKGEDKMNEKKLSFNELQELIKNIYLLDNTQNELYELSKTHKERFNEERRSEN
jgi:hypothetical protein